MSKELITREEQGRLVKRGEDESPPFSPVVKPITKLCEGREVETKGVKQGQAKTKEDCGKNHVFNPPLDEDDLRRIHNGALADLRDRKRNVGNLHPGLDRWTIDSEEEIHDGQRKQL
jgi:hypothetical protein